MERLFHFFGKAISVVINIVDPDAIVIGGGVGNISEIYTRGWKKCRNMFSTTDWTPDFLNLNWEILPAFSEPRL